MAIVQFVFAALKPGVSAADYERFEREVDYVIASKLKTIVIYRTHRITETGAGLSGGPWHYVERIEVTDRAAYEAELAVTGKELIDELYEKYLDKSKIVSVWSERIEPGPHAAICGRWNTIPTVSNKIKPVPVTSI